MSAGLNQLGRERAVELFAGWTDRIRLATRMDPSAEHWSSALTTSPSSIRG